MLLKTKKHVSRHIKLNMAFWIIASISSTVYSGYFLFNFRGEGKAFTLNRKLLNLLGTLYSVFVISLIGIVYFTILSCISLSVFFLLLDRCLIIAFPAKYLSKYKQRFEFISPILLICNFGLIFTYHLYTGLEEGHTTCLSAECLNTQEQSAVMIAVKYRYCGLNCLLAIVFAFMLFKYNQTRVMDNPLTRRANLMAAMTIISEFLFTVLPDTFVLIVFYVSGKSLYLYV
jgi:hypothetical protein